MKEDEQSKFALRWERMREIDKLPIPKRIMPQYLVRMQMECRVCGAVLENYTRNPLIPYDHIERDEHIDDDTGRMPNTEQGAFQCAIEMQKHLMEEHGLDREAV